MNGTKIAEEEAKKDAERFLALCKEREHKQNNLVRFWKVFGTAVIIATVYGAWRLFMPH